MRYDGREVMRQAAEIESEAADVAKRYPIGTQLVQADRVGEIVAVEPNGTTLVVKTNGVDRTAPYTVIDQYVAAGKLTVRKPE